MRCAAGWRGLWHTPPTVRPCLAWRVRAAIFICRPTFSERPLLQSTNPPLQHPLVGQIPNNKPIRPPPSSDSTMSRGGFRGGRGGGDKGGRGGGGGGGGFRGTILHYGDGSGKTTLMVNSCVCRWSYWLPPVYWAPGYCPRFVQSCTPQLRFVGLTLTAGYRNGKVHARLRGRDCLPVYQH